MTDYVVFGILIAIVFIRYVFARFTYEISNDDSITYKVKVFAILDKIQIGPDALRTLFDLTRSELLRFEERSISYMKLFPVMK